MPHTHKITPQEALQRTIEHREIFHDEMLHIMRLIMSGEMSPVMMAALITGLRVKKETIGEITAAAQVMREFSTKVQVADKTHLVDIVGTGGDGSHTFNISTCSMFVAAAAGAKVSKHGGRSVSSKSGSASTSTWRPRRLPNALSRSAWVSCLPPTTTRP
jgi:anthranilate phosphoribosyltransferase